MSTINRTWLGALILAGGFLVSSQASAQLSLGVGLNYNSGGMYNGAYGTAGMGYGIPNYGYGAMGGMAYCPYSSLPGYSPGGYFPGMSVPGMMPMGIPGGGFMNGGIVPPMGGGYGMTNYMPPAGGQFRTPSPYIPPHVAYGNSGWGAGYASYPGPGYGVCGIPCGAGLVQMPVYPVIGGPAMVGGCGGMWGSCGGSGYYGPVSGPAMSSGGGFAANGIIDIRSRNAWEIPDTAAIIQATGASMPAPYGGPVAFPSYRPTFTPTGFYSTGSRDFDHIDRPEGL